MGRHSITKRVNWGILKGEKGCRGKRGHRGKKGHDGRDAVLSFAYAANNVEQFIVNANTAVDFNDVFYPYLDANVNGNTLTLDYSGVYEFNYAVRGVSSNVANAVIFGLTNNGNLINGSVNSLLSANAFILNGSVITEVEECNANIQLLNMSLDDSVSYMNMDNSNNAMISVKRLA